MYVVRRNTLKLSIAPCVAKPQKHPNKLCTKPPKCYIVTNGENLYCRFINNAAYIRFMCVKQKKTNILKNNPPL